MRLAAACVVAALRRSSCDSALRARDQFAPPPHQKIPKIYLAKTPRNPHLSHRAAQISSPKRNTAPVLQRNPALFDNSITASRRTNFVGLRFSGRNPGTTSEPKGTQKYHLGTTKYHLGTSWEPLRNHKVPLFLPLKIIISAPAALYGIETPHFPTLRQTPLATPRSSHPGDAHVAAPCVTADNPRLENRQSQLICRSLRHPHSGHPLMKS